MAAVRCVGSLEAARHCQLVRTMTTMFAAALIMTSSFSQVAMAATDAHQQLVPHYGSDMQMASLLAGHDNSVIGYKFATLASVDVRNLWHALLPPHYFEGNGELTDIDAASERDSGGSFRAQLKASAASSVSGTATTASSGAGTAASTSEMDHDEPVDEDSDGAMTGSGRSKDSSAIAAADDDVAADGASDRDEEDSGRQHSSSGNQKVKRSRGRRLKAYRTFYDDFFQPSARGVLNWTRLGGIDNATYFNGNNKEKWLTGVYINCGSSNTFTQSIPMGRMTMNEEDPFNPFNDTSPLKIVKIQWLADGADSFRGAPTGNADGARASDKDGSAAAFSRSAQGKAWIVKATGSNYVGPPVKETILPGNSSRTNSTAGAGASGKAKVELIGEGKNKPQQGVVENLQREVSALGIPKRVFLSARYFTEAEGDEFTYSVPVAKKGLYWVRLFFAETQQLFIADRKFGVKIEGVQVLSEFSPSNVSIAMMKEFLVHVLDGAADVSLVRGSVGDPMISGIAVINAPDGMYHNMTKEDVIYETLHHLVPGLSQGWALFGTSPEPIRDLSGRVWTDDLEFYAPLYPFSWGYRSEHYAYNNALPGMAKYSNSMPELLPSTVIGNPRYSSQMTVIGVEILNSSGISYPEPNSYIRWTFQVQPNATYHMRLCFAVFSLPIKGARSMNVLINGDLIRSNFDPYSIVGDEQPYFLHLSGVNPSAAGRLEIRIEGVEGGLFYQPVFLSFLEIFQEHPTAAAGLSSIQEVAPPPPPPTAAAAAGAAPDSSSKTGEGGGGNGDNQLGMGIGIGFALGLLLAATVAAAALFILRRRAAKQQQVKHMSGEIDPKLLTYDASKLAVGGAVAAKGDHVLNVESGVHFQAVEKASLIEGDAYPAANQRIGLFGVRCFSLDELQGCCSFSGEAVIGRGGFGKVYYARLDSGFEVAIKRMKTGSQQGLKEFTTEIETLSRLNHKNLVNLVGYCNEEQELMLVYEFVANGTLQSHLKDEEKAQNLTWPRRLQIALGSARGIHYLHRGANPTIIHRDIKASNILVDANYNAKVSDFGLSKIRERVEGEEASQERSEMLGHISTNVKGTLGYLDPMYYKKQQLTLKSDVYSFGVVMLELLTGRKPIWQADFSSTSEQSGSDSVTNIVEWAAPFISRKEIGPIVAPTIDVDVHILSLQHFANMAFQCVQLEPSNRPNMSRVIRTLEEVKEMLKFRPLEDEDDDLDISLVLEDFEPSLKNN